MDKERHSDRRGHGRKRKIRILQHNMQRSKTVPYEIRTQMDAHGDNIILMQEPYTRGKYPDSAQELRSPVEGRSTTRQWRP